MLAALLTLALASPGAPLRAKEEHTFAVELMLAVDVAAAPLGGSNETVAQYSVGPGSALRAVVDDALWIEAWTAVGLEVLALQLTPSLRLAETIKSGRWHASTAVGWRFHLVDGFALAVGAGPSIDTYADVAIDLITVRALLGVMPVVAARFHVFADLYVDARIASSFIVFEVPQRLNAMASIGASWTFQ